MTEGGPLRKREPITKAYMMSAVEIFKTCNDGLKEQLEGILEKEVDEGSDEREEESWLEEKIVGKVAMPMFRYLYGRRKLSQRGFGPSRSRQT